MRTVLRIRWIVGALLVLLLAGCPRPSQPIPTPIPRTPAPPTLTPDAAAREGWTERQTGALAISLPSDWEVVDLTVEDAQTVFDELQQRAPGLARIIGGPEALQSAAFWAFQDSSAAPGLAGNLNIRRVDLDGQPIADLQAVMGPIVAQYQELGFQVAATDADLAIGGLPAARIAFSFTNGDAAGRPVVVQARQYLVAAGSDLWILSFSAAGDTIAGLAPLFERSASSFRVK